MTALALAKQQSNQGLEEDVFIPRASEQFVVTEQVASVCRRAMAYLDAGYAVHLAGPSGIGKTTLAFHLASQLEQPAVLMQGNHELGASEILGKETGYRRSRVVDNYIHSVMKTEEEMREFWVENRLARACRKGYTLIYDEFNRSPPEANNVLLSVLEERLLNLPAASDQGYVKVSPKFRAIFTSNPEEYAGTHQTQDALLDRMITIRLRPLTRKAEVDVVAKRSGLDGRRVAMIQAVVAAMRQEEAIEHLLSIRTTVAIAKVVARQEIDPWVDKGYFEAICRDCILSASHHLSEEEYQALGQRLAQRIEEERQ